jgi:hypothetical protein
VYLPKLMQAATAFALCCVAGCAEAVTHVASPLPTTVPTMPSSGATAYITVSELSPKVGDTVIVSLAILEAAGRQASGSFTLRVSYAQAGLRYVETVPQGEGMVAANASDSTIMIAGASTGGFASGTLARMRMLVLDPSAIHSLALKVLELNSIRFADESRFTTVDPAVFVSPPPRDPR